MRRPKPQFCVPDVGWSFDLRVPSYEAGSDPITCLPSGKRRRRRKDRKVGNDAVSANPPDSSWPVTWPTASGANDPSEDPKIFRAYPEFPCDGERNESRLSASRFPEGLDPVFPPIIRALPISGSDFDAREHLRTPSELANGSSTVKQFKLIILSGIPSVPESYLILSLKKTI